MTFEEAQKRIDAIVAAYRQAEIGSYATDALGALRMRDMFAAEVAGGKLVDGVFEPSPKTRRDLENRRVYRWLRQLKVGDTVLLKESFGKNELTGVITGETPTRWHVGSFVYQKGSGARHGYKTPAPYAIAPPEDWKDGEA